MQTLALLNMIDGIDVGLTRSLIICLFFNCLIKVDGARQCLYRQELKFAVVL